MAPSLHEYQRKRDFRRSREPPGAASALQSGHLYVMHKHAARHDHFDLRIEQDGALRSWALPKGPALESGEKRLAIEVEDHPLEYGSFEGTIPQGEYGAGTVMLWDVGRWQPNGRNDDEQIDFILTGTKLKGAWTLVRMRGRGGRDKGKQWLLIKRSDHTPHPLHPDDLSVATGRSMAEIAANKASHEARALPTPPVAKELHGARRAKPPAILSPQLGTLSERAPAGQAWLHEIKFDGYRIVVHLEQGKARLMTRNGHDWTARLRTQARQLETLPVRQAILDGELVALNAGGASSFRELQEALSRKQTAPLIYQLFDLIYLDGYDLSAVPLIERKKVLAQLLDAADFDRGGVVRYTDHVQGQGADFFEQACTLGLEGIISKRANAPYRSGRSKLWLKAKCTQHVKFVVGGYTPPSGARSGFGALLLGAWRDGQLEYAGRVGTGFSSRQLDQLHTQLQRQEIAQSPFIPSAALPAGARGVHWVKPRLVVEVEYTERTRDGLLRHPSFLGIREDLEPEQITSSAILEEAAPISANRSMRRHASTGAVEVAGVEITHPERILYPEHGMTKLALARYYESIQEWLLPYLARRPLVLLRCPEGRQACFYQKHLGKSQARSVPRIAIEEGGSLRDYVYVRSLADMVALAQHGALEIHPWGCQVDDIEHPDMMIFDLDPAPGVAWEEVLRTARELRERLAAFGLKAFVRTTGGKGLHLVVPLRPEADWHAVKEFARMVAEQHARDEPQLLTTTMAMSKRHGRIFIDYLRNARGSTAIACYSPRARPGAPVAVPLRWDELSAAVHSGYYTVETVQRRLRALKADPWEGFFEAAVTLSEAVRRGIGQGVIDEVDLHAQP
jgi:bifunctional non-homologous end joining protein LigD